MKINSGSEGTVYKQQFPFYRNILTIEDTIINEIADENIEIKNIISNYFDYKDINTEIAKDVGKILHKPITKNILLEYILSDIKNKLLCKN
jgi:hypothetical protein